MRSRWQGDDCAVSVLGRVARVPMGGNGRERASLSTPTGGARGSLASEHERREGVGLAAAAGPWLLAGHKGIEEERKEGAAT